MLVKGNTVTACKLLVTLKITNSLLQFVIPVFQFSINYRIIEFLHYNRYICSKKFHSFSFQVIKKVNGTEISWALGSAFHLLYTMGLAK